MKKGDYSTHHRGNYKGQHSHQFFNSKTTNLSSKFNPRQEKLRERANVIKEPLLTGCDIDMNTLDSFSSIVGSFVSTRVSLINDEQDTLVDLKTGESIPAQTKSDELFDLFNLYSLTRKPGDNFSDFLPEDAVGNTAGSEPEEERFLYANFTRS